MEAYGDTEVMEGNMRNPVFLSVVKFDDYIPGRHRLVDLQACNDDELLHYHGGTSAAIHLIGRDIIASHDLGGVQLALEMIQIEALRRMMGQSIADGPGDRPFHSVFVEADLRIPELSLPPGITTLMGENGVIWPIKAENQKPDGQNHDLAQQLTSADLSRLVEAHNAALAARLRRAEFPTSMPTDISSGKYKNQEENRISRAGQPRKNMEEKQKITGRKAISKGGWGE